jgi:hypothetical protein
MITFFYSLIGIPTVGLNFAEKLIIFHHARAAWLMMFQINKTLVAKTISPSWQMLRNNVGVYVNFVAQCSN